MRCGFRGKFLRASQTLFFFFLYRAPDHPVPQLGLEAYTRLCSSVFLALDYETGWSEMSEHVQIGLFAFPYIFWSAPDERFDVKRAPFDSTGARCRGA